MILLLYHTTLAIGDGWANLFEWVSAIYDFFTSVIDTLLYGFRYIFASAQNVLVYNGYVPALFGGVVVAFVVVAIVKAIFGR